MDAKAPAPPAPGLELAPVEAHALLHAEQAMAGVAGARAGPWPAVGDLYLERVVRPGHPHIRGRAAGVLERVGEALLDEPEGGEVEPGRQLAPLARHAQLDRQAGLPRALDQLAQSAHARLGRTAGRLARLLVIEHAEQPAHL